MDPPFTVTATECRRSRQGDGPSILTSAIVFPSAYTLHWQAMDWAQLITLCMVS